MKKVSLKRFFVYYGIFFCFSNVAHPITPTMFTEWGFPDYMFGVSFAAMAFAMFLTSPFWGKLGDKMGHAAIMGITMPIYAFSQYWFGVSQTPLIATIARLCCGASSGAVVVASMAYVVSVADERSMGRTMSCYAAINSIMSAFGYFIGGVVGSWSLRAVFVIQTAVITVLGIVTYLTLGDTDRDGHAVSQSGSLNPFRAFLDMRGFLSVALITFLVTVFLANFATTAYDNAFNYYLKAALMLPSSYNGIIKAVIGIISLAVNFTINIYIINKTNIMRTIIGIFAMCGITSGAVVLMPGMAPFFAANIIFFMFNAIYIPVQQVIATQIGDAGSSGTISGTFNSVKSMGMIFGALIAGFVYMWSNTLPFIMASAAFLISAVVAFVNYRQCKNKVKENQVNG